VDSVYNRVVDKRLAVLDTSFWSGAVHVGVDAYLPLFFARPLSVPTAVVREIERLGQPSSPRLREDQQRCRLWLEDGRLLIVDPVRPYGRFGAGEAASLGLALEQPGAVLLVNEVRCYVEAVRLGVHPVAVSEVVVRLARSGIIAGTRAASMLDLLEETTGTTILERARRAIAEGGAPE